MTKLWTMLVLCGALCVVSANSARADEPCPTTSDNLNQIMYIADFPGPSVETATYYIGQVNFYGVSTVAVCIEQNSWFEMFAVGNADNGGLLGWLPKTFNHLCFSGQKDLVHVVASNQVHCLTQMTPLNYNGNWLVLHTLGGNDMVTGGNGQDMLYGGADADFVQDFSFLGQTYGGGGMLYGESGNDTLKGAFGDETYLDGGDGNDAVGDLGGSGDWLYGRNGDECCMEDAGENYARFQCGTGWDVVNTRSGKGSDCNAQSSDCRVETFYLAGGMCDQ